jgi:hypothetical protein
VTTAEILTISGQAVVLAGSVLGFAATRRSVGRVRRDVGQVHELVNNRSDRQDARIEQLSGTLTDAGVDVPKLPES